MASDFDVSKKLTEEVQKLFLNIENAVQKRKADLLRQIEFLAQQYQMHNINIDCIEKIKILPENEDDVLNVVKTFGKINFNDFYVDCDLFKVEDYQKPENDHVCLYKCLNVCEENSDTLIVNVTNLNTNDIISKFQNNSIDSIDNLSNTKEQVVLCEPFVSDHCSVVENLNPKENSLLECIEKQDPSLCSHNLSKVTSHLAATKEDVTTTTILECLSNENQSQELCSCFSATIHKSSSISNSVPNLNCECNDTIDEESDHLIINDLEMPKLKQMLSAEDLHKISVDRVRKLSKEHPVLIQEWMKQIIAEPETEPVQNNELLEYKQY